MKRTCDYDDHLNDIIVNKLLAMCNTLDQKFRKPNEEYRELARQV